MNNRVGIGVFGTFGEPLGYQQLFYHGVSYNGSLDIEEDKIELYPGEHLYAVKRELVDGVYAISCCIYTYVRELNTERFGTFLGNCIVLQDSFADADYVYAALKALHEQVLGTSQNVENSILTAHEAKDVILREPESFIALKANIIPISKTPFFSSAVNEAKEHFVTPNPLSERSKEEQLIDFFDKAIKDYTDTTALFFSFDRNVYDFVLKANKLDLKDWDEFYEYKIPNATVVRTKKGIHKGHVTTAAPATQPEPEADSYIAPTPSVTDEPIVAPLTDAILRAAQGTPPPTPVFTRSGVNMDDPNRPFDLWDEPIPDNGWPREEVTYRVKEYNRLFRYTNTLLEHINEPAGRRREEKRKRQQQGTDTDSAYTVQRRRPIGAIILLILVLMLAGVAFFITTSRKKNKEKAAVTLLTPDSVQQANTEATDTMSVDNTVAEDTVTEAELQGPIPKVPVAGAKLPETEATKQTQGPAPMPVTQPKASSLNLTDPSAAEETTPRNLLMPKNQPAYPRTGELHPRPNIEMSQNDIAMLREMGVKNKSVAEITRMLFDNAPTNIGIIYKGQEMEYCALLLNSNKQAFKKYGNDFICTTNETPLHIPAYKSPRLPAVYPK